MGKENPGKANPVGARHPGKPGNPNWVKGGKSPNPGGRHRIAEQFRSDCRDFSPTVREAWQNEVSMRGPNWVKCSELIAAYGMGKPVQPTESKVDVTVSDVREMSRERLLAIAAGSDEHVEH